MVYKNQTNKYIEKNEKKITQIEHTNLGIWNNNHNKETNHYNVTDKTIFN